MRKLRVYEGRSLKLAAGLALAGAFAFGDPVARAASAVWNATATDGNWITSTDNNWSTGAGTFPGSISDPTNFDTATFNSDSNYTSLGLSQSLYIGNIDFDDSASSYTIGSSSGGSLLLSAGGSVSILSTLTSTSSIETIGAPIVLEGNATFSNDASAAASVLDFNGGGVTAANANTVLTLSGSNTGANLISANIGYGANGSLALVKSGSGSWTLSGSNTYTGGTTIGAGSLIVSSAAALGTGAVNVAAGGDVRLSNVTITGNTITLAGTGAQGNDFGALSTSGDASGTWAGNVVLTSGAYIGTNGSGTLTIAGSISGSTDLVISAANGAGTVVLQGFDTYTGQTQIVRGTLKLGGGLALPLGTVVDVHNLATTDPAVVDLNGFGASISGLQQSNLQGTATVTNSASAFSTLVISSLSSGSYNFSGVLSGNLNVAMNGRETQQFSGNNTYLGTTVVNVGTLTFTGNNDLGGDVTLNTGSFTATGVNTFNGNFTSNLATVVLGANNTVSGNLNVYGGSVTIGDVPEIDGNLTTTGGTTTLGANGIIYGDLFGNGGTIALGANANIYGNLVASNATVNVGSGLTVWGDVIGNQGAITLGPGALIQGSVTGNGAAISINNAQEIDGDVWAYAGTVTLSGSNLIDGSFGASPGGTLALDFTGVSGQDIITGYVPLEMAGGTAKVIATGSTVDSQQFPGLQLDVGDSTVQVSSSPSNSVLVSLGPISRAIGAAVNFVLPAGAPSATNGITTTTPNANYAGGQPTILAGYATVGDTWAVSASDGTNPGLISGLTSYTPVSTDFGTTTSVAGKDIDVVGSNTTQTASAVTVNSIRFNVGNNTLTLDGPVAVATGGILVGSGSSGGMIQGGSITSGNGTDLIIIDRASGTFAISSAITDNGMTSIGLTKNGNGQFITSSQSTYTGPTTLVNGLVVPQSNSTGGTPGDPDSGPFGRGTLVFDGAQFSTSTSSSSAIIANDVTLAADTTFLASAGQGSLTFTGPMTLANGNRTITNNSQNDVSFSGPIGDGGNGYVLTFAGTGRTILSGANTYIGGTSINSGIVLANAPAGDSATGSGNVSVTGTGVLGGTGFVSPRTMAEIVVQSGGTLTAGTGTSTADTPGNLTLNGTTFFGGGTSQSGGRLLIKFNPNDLGSGGATTTGNNPTATTDPGGRGADWDEITIPAIDIYDNGQGNLINVSTVAVSPSGAGNAFNSTSSYSWPVVAVTQGVSGFWLNNVAATSQASLQAQIAGLFRLDPSGLEAATGTSNPGAFSIGVAPDPWNASYEDLVINYSPVPEPSGVALLGVAAGVMLVRRRRSHDKFKLRGK